MQTLELELFHGRINPEEKLDDWGFNGPSLVGITDLYCINGTHTIWFASAENFKEAHKLTDWPYGHDDCTLEIPFQDRFVVCRHIDAEGKSTTAYFSDWCLKSRMGGN